MGVNTVAAASLRSLFLRRVPAIRLRSRVLGLARPWLDRHARFKSKLRTAENNLGLLKHTAATVLPTLIQPRPERITIAVTASCNLRCTGCRYGRDFMPGHQLSLSMVRDLLDDAKAAGISTVRLYGGEPLLHPDLPEMIRHACRVGVRPFITTNGRLLRQKIDALYEAGLRQVSIGYYGAADEYDAYVGSRGAFRQLERGVATVRDRYGASVEMQMNFVLMRPTCSVQAIRDAWAFARRYGMTFRVDLIHYSLPYFSEGPDRTLQFTGADTQSIAEAVRELVALKQAHPEMFRESVAAIRSIPDWLLKGPDMRVPCDAYNLIWVGADGTVQLCYVTFRLGNLHRERLRDMLFSPAHQAGARGAFTLGCPNCHCERNTRIQKHLPSRIRYRALPG
jgi:MoaA/NifB/PqqE/SkfB family radical SAM enzyme